MSFQCLGCLYEAATRSIVICVTSVDGDYDWWKGRQTVLASSFYSQYGLVTIFGLPLKDDKGRYGPEKSMTDSKKISRSW
ncbi:hypothetical protein TNCV_1186701 [Trichonephila clavipes]|nr:hypothetical protein TNCV_1186701 [Trichonephila clavipes]